MMTRGGITRITITQYTYTNNTKHKQKDNKDKAYKARGHHDHHQQQILNYKHMNYIINIIIPNYFKQQGQQGALLYIMSWLAARHFCFLFILNFLLWVERCRKLNPLMRSRLIHTLLLSVREKQQIKQMQGWTSAFSFVPLMARHEVLEGILQQ